ncbi:MAG: type II toxin-antitoxin system RelE/ParE family toxin [Sphingobacteriales bacterium]|nr:MAG: type II toxin-antitoxin system RelE/ParE family toxin [Sphingobacteriales bacterium]
MLIVEWKWSAIEDLKEIIGYIAQFNPMAADMLESQILESSQRLSDHPYSGRDGKADGTRELLVHANYFLVYKVTSKIEIVNVVHTRKKYPLH